SIARAIPVNRNSRSQYAFRGNSKSLRTDLDHPIVRGRHGPELATLFRKSPRQFLHLGKDVLLDVFVEEPFSRFANVRQVYSAMDLHHLAADRQLIHG